MSSLSPKQRAAAIELAQRQEKRKALRAGLFDLQLEVVDCPERNIAMLCGRRAGKTSTLLRLIALTLLDCGRNERVGFASASRKLARELVWAELKALLDDIGCNEASGWRILENEGTIETPRGGIFQLFGFDDLPSLEKCRGFKFRLFCMDEIAMVAKQAEYIVDSSVGPALIDLRGKLVIAGTPGIALTGFWYLASTGQHPRFKKVFRWTLRENKKFPRDPDEAIREELEQNGWTEQTPRFRREILAEWVTESSMLVWSEYRPEVNKVPALPRVRQDGWRYLLSVDYGGTDPNAFTILGSPRDSPVIYVVETRQEKGLPPEAVSGITKELVERYKVERAVGDAAAKAYIDDFNARWAHVLGVWIERCEKTDKVGQIEVVNALFRQGHLKLAGDHPELEHEIATWQWSDEHRTQTPKRAADHGSDSLRYGVYTFRTAHQAPRPAPPPDPLADFDRRARAELERQSEARGWESHY